MSLEYLDMVIAFVVVMLSVSLLVTICVQLVSAVLGLRGTNLLWGVTQLLRTVHPTLGDRAESVARAVLEHQLISDSSLSRFPRLAERPLVGRWFKRLRLAKAVRVEELIGIMGIIAERRVAAAAPPGGLTAVLAGDAAGTVQVARSLDQRSGTNELTPAKADIEAWFNTAMDRTSQRFAFQARLWTVAFSVLIAFALHLDTFTLLQQFASNAEIRARVAGVSDSIEQLAAASLAAPRPTTADQQTVAGPPTLYHAAMTTLSLPAQTKADMPAFFADRVTAVEWLRASLVDTGMAADEIEKQVAAYAGAIDSALVSDADRLSDRALSIRGILRGTGFQLIPSPYHSWDFWPPNLHLWGVVFSACLLSLGAPFWYNSLKGLSALKPVVASKEARERQAHVRNA